MAVMSRVTLVLVSMLLAACGPGGIEPDAGVQPDGVGDPSGLELRWTASGLGEPVGPVVLDRLRLELRDLRVIGDAAPEATYRASQQIELQLGGVTEQVTRFTDAPPGRYSAFEFSIDRPGDGERAWELRGECEIDGEIYDLDIEDDEMTAISLPFVPNLTLSAGETGVITLEIDVAMIVQGVDWDSQAPDGGDETLSIDDDSPLLPGMRQRLRGGIRITGIDIE